MKQRLFALILMISPLGAMADFSSAMDAYERKDYRAAHGELTTLANHNDVDAQYMLGYMYALGEGVLQDYVEAHKWLNLAASQGKEGAREAREEVARRMTPTQVARAQALARDWQPQEQMESTEGVSGEVSPEPYTPDRETIIQVQRRLAELGYDPGPADGAPGQRTRRAIRNYQVREGLTVDGRISRELVESLLPAVADGSLPRRYAKVWEADAQVVDEETRALVDELQSLIDKAVSQRAADRWLVQELRELARLETSSWPELLLHESFAEGDYRWNPEWSSRRGSFRLERGEGLVLTPEAGRPSSSRDSSDLAGSLFDAFIGRGSSGNDARERGRAEIVLRKEIPNGFALRVDFSASEEPGRLVFRLGQGVDGRTGYRLVIETGGRGGVDLIRVDGRGRSVIRSSDSSQGLTSGRLHGLEWTRDGNGEMAVAIDGEEMFRVADSAIRDGYTRIGLASTGTELVLRELMLFGGNREN